VLQTQKRIRLYAPFMGIYWSKGGRTKNVRRLTNLRAGGPRENPGSESAGPDCTSNSRPAGTERRT
jgi:hypothetical protein